MFAARFSILACGMVAVMTGLVACDDSQVTSVTYQTFKKAVSNFGAVLIKFDEPYPSKTDQEKEYKKLAEDLRFTTNLLVTEMKVPFRSDGTKDDDVSDERRFAEKLKGTKTEDFPVVYLFKKGQLDSPIRFDKKEDGSNFNVVSLRQFVRSNVPSIKILLESCVEALDVIAEKFSKVTTDEKRKSLLKEAAATVAKLGKDLQASGKVYVKVMERVVERGTMFLTSERQRITNLLAGQMSDQKKKQLQGRLNILESFQTVTKEDGKQEL